MRSNISRRSALAGVSAVAVAAALPAISTLAAVEQDPIAELGRRWLAARERWSHWGHIEDELAFKFGKGSPEHREPKRLFDEAHDEMLELEGAMSRGQATTFAGLLARWEILEWLGVETYPGPDAKAIAMRADLERLSGGAL